MQNKAIFLDRDGTINKDKKYVYKKEDLEFLPGAIKGLKRFQELGYKLIIITNQSGIGMGIYTEEQYREFMEHFLNELKKQGVVIDGIYYCKHAPEENCECRKPKTKMIEDAIKKHGIDKNKSYFIGDKTADILAGKNAGLKTILVMTKGGNDNMFKVVPDMVVIRLDSIDI